MALGVASAIVAAIMGWGFWSLVVLAGAQFLVYRLVVLWVVAARGSVPQDRREA